jgi:hypothetical protein
MVEKKRLFATDGVTLAGVILLSNECMKLCDMGMPDGKAYFWSIVCVVGTIGLDLLFRENEEEKLFRNCGIENIDDMVPLIIKKEVSGK